MHLCVQWAIFQSFLNLSVSCIQLYYCMYIVYMQSGLWCFDCWHETLISMTLLMSCSLELFFFPFKDMRSPSCHFCDPIIPRIVFSGCLSTPPFPISPSRLFPPLLSLIWCSFLRFLLVSSPPFLLIVFLCLYHISSMLCSYRISLMLCSYRISLMLCSGCFNA